MFDISVGEYLEFEFRFEVATFLGIETAFLMAYRDMHPEEAKYVARHVLLTICTEQCRKHMFDKKTDAATGLYAHNSRAAVTQSLITNDWRCSTAWVARALQSC